MGTDWPIEFIEKDNEGLPIIVPVLMRTRMIGDILLDHTEDPFDGIWQYPIVPYNAYFLDGYEMGVVDKTGANKLMGMLMKDLKGKADGTAVKAVVDNLFV